MRYKFLSLILLHCSICIAQDICFPIGGRVAQAIDRIDVLSEQSSIHTSVQPYTRTQLSEVHLDDNNTFTESLLNEELVLFQLNSTPETLIENTLEMEFVDSTNTFYTYGKTKIVESKRNLPKKGPAIFGHFYKQKGAFYKLDTEYLKMTFDPILNIKFGDDRRSEEFIFQNTRGIEIQGIIDDKVYFYTSLIENQGRFQSHIERRIARYQSIPGFGSFKPFSSSVIDRARGWDFPNSQAYVGFNMSKHIGIELGHGRHFIGNGYQSLLLSDYANNYFYLKFSTKVWKLHYQNIFAETNPISAQENPGDNLLDKKYFASHYLSIKPRENIEIGLFETVVFSRQNQFELQYLNPIILYRTVEFFLDSPDNVLIGLNAKWNLWQRFSIYGQLILDEFKLNELRESSGWWANKYGFQAGIKYINALNIKKLDLQAEFNLVRPYTYGHRDAIPNFPNTSIANYSHQNQPLAHPLGANFREIIGIARYKPWSSLFIQSKAMYAIYGDSTDGLHWGNDILIPNQNRVMEFGNEIGQGVSNTVVSISMDISYEFFHDYYFDLHLMYRNQDSEDDLYDIKTNYIGCGIRANIENLKLDY